MAQPYVGEIRMFGGTFAPVGWLLCQGQILPISQYDVLFNLIGTTYGGDGQSTFALPDLRGRVPVHQGAGFSIGQNGGTETVTLTTGQMPSHRHVPAGNSTGANAANSPAGNVWAASAAVRQFSSNAPTTTMNPGTVANTGGSQPHDNMLPFLAVNFIIAYEGIFPSQN